MLRNLSYIFLGLVVAVSLILVLVNYSSLAALILGVLLSLVTLRTFRFLKPKISRIRRILVQGSLILFFLIIVILSFFVQPMSGPPRPNITSYSLTIKPDASNHNQFSFSEEIIYQQSFGEEEQYLAFPQRKVMSSSKGFLLREVAISPLEETPSNLPLIICTYSCAPAKVIVRDLPKNSFVSARYVDKIETRTYIDLEEVEFTVSDVKDGVSFSYIVPPFQYLRPLINPFLGISTVGQLVFTVVGLIITPFISSIIGSELKTATQTVVKRLFSKRKDETLDQEGRETPKTAKLITSPKGKEKEVEVKENS